MDTCTNCGATLRPGAKFCTTCGTRLNDMPAPNGGWGTPRSDAQDDSQQTTVLNAVQPPTESSNSSDSSKIGGSRQRSSESWTFAYGGDSSATPPPATSDDPASRFISALDDDVQPATDEKAGDSQGDPASTWSTPNPVFTPPPPSNWSYNFGDESQTANADASEDSNWGTPTSWASVHETSELDDVKPESDDADASEGFASTWATARETTEPADDEPNVIDSAGFTEGGDEVDALSGDENVELAEESAPDLAPDEARDKAIALADELRRTIRLMSSGGESDHGAAVMALTEASLNVGDFSDLRGVLADVKNDPRDIQILGNLAGKVDRIDVLIEEHKALADAIEAAIKELNG